MMSSTITWENSVIKYINDEHLPNTKIYKWDMPRMSGVTTFLVNFANFKIFDGNSSILFITFDSNIRMKLHPKIDILIVRGNSIGNSCKGKIYDYIFVDTVNLTTYEFDSLLPCLKLEGKMLWMNTTEGHLK